MTRWGRIGRDAVAGAALGLTVLGPGACATQSLRLVEQRGAAPQAGRYAVAADPEAPAPAGLAAAVDRRLSAQGLAAAEDQPQFRVEALYSERQGPVGAFNATGGDNAPVWLASPPRIRWWSWNRRPRLRQLTLRILDAGSGAEIYRGVAVEQGGKAGPVDWDRLVVAAAGAE